MNKKTIPFDLFTALKIQAGITKGRFVTRSGHAVRIVCWNKTGRYPIIGIREGQIYDVDTYTPSGEFRLGTESSLDLLIELEEEGEK